MKERYNAATINRKLVRVYSFVFYIEENVKMFATLLRLGEWNCEGFFNRFHPRMEPISSWKFIYRMQIQRTFSFRWRTILWFSLFLIHCRITRDIANRRIMKENINALQRGILSIILRTGILQHRWFIVILKNINNNLSTKDECFI